MKKNFFLAGIALLILTTAFPDENDKPENLYRWALVTVTEENVRSLGDKTIPFWLLQNRVILYFLPYPNTYLYLFALGPEGEVEKLFPGSFELFTKDSYFYQPVFQELGELQASGGKGCRELILLAAGSRLFNLEKDYQAYQAAGSKEKKAWAADFSQHLGQLRAMKNLLFVKPPPPGKILTTFRSEKDLGIAIGDLGEERHFLNFDEVRIVYGCETDG